ncbi:MAG TPA: ankyrin repeat domain-containing protein [Actinomycetota bacterium]|jgi:ankyrin repeat protein
MNSTAVIEAVKEGDVARLRELVASEPGAASARDADGSSALILAVYRDRQDLVDVLLSARPTIDVFEAAAIGDEGRLRRHLDRDEELVHAWSRDGFTPLHLAAFFGHEAAARLLVERGADPSVVSQSPMGVAPLHSAAAGDNGAVARLLVEAGADVNARQRGGWVPLHSAASNGDAELVRFLLDNGADPDARQDEGKSAADVAAEKGHDEIAALLSETAG